MKTESKIALELQKIGENKLTNDIIIPLLESMGYDKVEFNGGPKEEGKDIILWDRDKFDNRKLSVAQIKHFKATNTAADQKSFQGIINQLENCFSRTLINTVDLKPYSPSEVLFITSYAVDTATLHTRFSLERALKDHKILIIDGLRLSELLIKHKPEIVRSLIGIDHDIASKTTSSLNNRILLDALGHHEDLELQNIYTHIDFSLGKHSTHLFFSDGLKPINKVVRFGYEDWVDFKKYCELIKSEYIINFMESTIDSLDKENKTSLFKHAKWKSTHQGLSHSLQEASNNSNSLRKKYKKMKFDLDEMFNQIKSNGEQPDQDQEFKSLERSLRNMKNNLDKTEKERALFGGLFENSLKSEPKLVIEFHVYGEKLIEQITEKRIWIEKQINLLNIGDRETIRLQTFIVRAKEIIDATEILLSNPTLFQGLVREDGKVRRNSYESTRLKLNIQEIFHTGHNFMVLGEAGAGKTTSLQMYARNMIGKEDSQVLWVPLARLIQNWFHNDKISTALSFKNNLEKGIVHYLNFISLPITLDEFVHLLKSQKMVLLLDGIDEAIKIAPWLPEAIVSLSSRFKTTVQLIVTTRLSSTFLEKIPFFPVTLLPFTIEQRDRFIELWFKNEPDEKIINRIKKHLITNTEISEIIRNPLLTTTLCVLAKHKLPLPRTEINLYNDRIRLLTGYYDNAKHIHARISVTPNNLEILAQRIAFYMHKNNLREAELSELEGVARKVMINELDLEQSVIALYELVDPCNILMPSEEGLYGFGHLRYQEHLAAKEINSNRGIDIVQLLKNPWWHGVIVLFSRLSLDLEWLIKEVAAKEKINAHYNLISDIIELRPKGEQENLQSLLYKYHQLEIGII